jgi:hypothetical protein
VSIADDIARIERERKAREKGLLLWMLSLAERARLNVVRAIRVGAVWTGVLRGVFVGDDRIDQPGGAGVLSKAMADSYLTGYHRAGLLVDVRLGPPALLADVARDYVPEATQALDRIGRSLETAVAEEIQAVVAEDRISADAAAVGEAFRKAGWTPENPTSATGSSSGIVLKQFAVGMHNGFKHPDVVAVLTGLHFVNPLDAVTTDICRKRAGTKLPLDHPWWFRNWPPLHYGCRSVVLPMMREFTPTESPPDFPPPDPGWGTYSGLLTGTFQ